MIIYARVNRQIEARWYGKAIRPLEFILFDDPRLSTPMVERNPEIALCFPMQIIAWEDEMGRCRIAFKDPLEWPHLQQVITPALSE